MMVVSINVGLIYIGYLYGYYEGYLLPCKHILLISKETLSEDRVFIYLLDFAPFARKHHKG